MAHRATRPARTLAQLQRQLDRFRRYYSTVRPHRAIGRRTPTHAYTARPEARPTGSRIEPHYRLRRDRADTSGVITLRYDSRLRHIGLGREHARKRVRALAADTGTLLRELTLDPRRDYQPPGNHKKTFGRSRARTSEARMVADHGGNHVRRLDRARCRSCGTTHVLLPVDLVAGRAYPARVIGAALVAGGEGIGHRRVAARLDMPAATVRSWLRRARQNAPATFQLAIEAVVALNQDLLPTTPRPTALGDATAALTAAATATAARFGLRVPDPWSLINLLSRGRLLMRAASP